MSVPSTLHNQGKRWLRVLARGLIGAALLLSACGSGASSTSSNTPTTNATQVISGAQGKIKHIVFFIKENRTFDNYFGTYPGANGATSATTAAGRVVPLQHQKDQIPDIDHSSQGAIMAYDQGKMDKFNLLHSSSRPLDADDIDVEAFLLPALRIARQRGMGGMPDRYVGGRWREDQLLGARRRQAGEQRQRGGAHR